MRTPEETRADRFISVGIDLGAKALEIGSASEGDQDFAGDDRAAAKHVRRRAIRSGPTLSESHREAECDQHRGRERGDDD